MGNLNRAIWVGRILVLCFVGLVLHSLNYSFTSLTILNSTSVFYYIALTAVLLSLIRPFSITSQGLMWIVMFGFSMTYLSDYQSTMLLVLILFSANLIVPIYYHKMLSLSKWHETARITSVLGGLAWIVSSNVHNSHFWTQPLFWIQLSIVVGLGLTLLEKYRKQGLTISALIVVSMGVESAISGLLNPDIYAYISLFSSAYLLSAYNPHRAGMFRYKVQQIAFLLSLGYLIVAFAPSEVKSQWTQGIGAMGISELLNKE